MGRSFALIAILLLSIGIFGCGKSKDETAGKTKLEEAKSDAARKSGPPQGTIDSIDGDPVVGNRLELKGWAADPAEGAPMKRVEVLVDSKIFAHAITGLPRQDVADAFKRDDWLKSGWTAEVYLNNVTPGAHMIQVVAYNSKNMNGILSNKRTVVVKAKADHKAI